MRRIISIFRSAFPLVACVMLATGCKENSQQQAEILLQQARQQFEAGEYQQAVTTIDSLRHAYPNAIDTRKQALHLYQEIELKRAQEELAQTDSLLQLVQHNYDSLQAKLEKDKAELRAMPEELTMLTRTRMKRDSLRTQCETLGAKIRYIHKKQEDQP